MSTTNNDSLESKLLGFFGDMASAKESSNYDSDKESFVFHITDWSPSLDLIAKLYSNPACFSQEESKQILQDLLYHVLPHLNAAAEIYDDAPEIYTMHNKRKPC